jgi:NAD(P)-dependent dehydrogenase (short-subunit alcohol dehydrogenase family)
MNKSIIVTGANIGIGKEVSRQLAMIEETEVIYLACRNADKAIEAKASLEEQTGRSIFQILIMDVSDPVSVKQAVESLETPVDALIMNAGGLGGKNPSQLSNEGTTMLFATNVLGHVVLVDELIKENKLNNVALYVSTEAVRGVKSMGMKRPELKTSSVTEFSSIANGTYFGEKMDPMQAYGHVKYMATLWMSSMARKQSKIRFISMSPGGTKGTNMADDMGPVMKFMFKHVMMPVVMPMMGMAHSLETGAGRLVTGINDDTLRSGVFYASKKSLTGPTVDQSAFFPDLNNTGFQDNADKAIHLYIN